MPSFSVLSGTIGAQGLGNGEFGYLGRSAVIETVNVEAVGATLGLLEYAEVTIHGEVTVRTSNAIDMTGGSSDILIGQNGVVTAQGTGSLNLGTIVQRIQVVGQIANFGEIYGSGTGIFVQGDLVTAQIEIRNAGLVHAEGSGISLFSVGTFIIDNTGTISGFNGGIRADSFSSVATSRLDLTNGGLISGGTGPAIVTGNLANTIRNTGMIDGDVIFGTGADGLDNRGGQIDGTIRGGAGADTFRLGAGIEIIDGGADFDAIDFRGTPAVVVALDESIPNTGHAAGDEYTGVEGIFGSYFADLLIGSAGANTLRGFGGNDTLEGGAGSDKIVGGNGVDTATGGAGSDTFVFDKLSETGDVITDFGSSAGNSDVFNIRASAFGGGLVAGGAIAAAQFQSRADNAAQDADDRFIFRTTDRTLWFDADGNGAGAAVMVADLQAGATVDRFDIILI